MKFSHAWLAEYVPISESPEALGARLTGAGLPLDGIETVVAAAGEADRVYDFDIPANRPDAMNHVGLAREYAALTGAALSLPEPAVPRGGAPTAAAVAVAIEATDLCGRYAARCVGGVSVGPSPAWLRRRLESIGQRAVNNVVDATNFVLWEMGQPLHPFDLARVEGARLVVRRARAGESLTTLDGVARALGPDMLVIADARRPVALAGILGGADTGITPGTRTVLLESAWFDPVSVRRTARALGLRTDASHRFERGADPEVARAALDRAAVLIAEIAGGTVSDPPLDVRPRAAERRLVPFRPARARALLGLEPGPGAHGLSDDVMRAALERRAFAVKAGAEAAAGPAGGRAAADGRAWNVEVPSFRRDVEREVDLIEEVARHRGYDAVPLRLPPIRCGGTERAEPGRAAAHRALLAAGCSEAINYTMVDREECLLFDPGLDTPVALTNPLQENAAFLRSSLLPGLLRNTAHNLNHGLPGVALYEIGTIFRPGAPGPAERIAAAFVLAGRAQPAHFTAPRRDYDRHDARGALELAAELAGAAPPEFSSDRIPFLAPGEALRVVLGGRPLGVVGAVAPALLERYGIGRPVLAGEFDPEVLAAARRAPRYRALPRYPAVRRDLAVIVKPGTTYEDVARVIREASPLRLAGLEVFDRYRGPGVPAGCTSLALQIVFQHDERTLASAEVQEAVEAIVAALQRALDARLRGAG